ncbi:MAG: hypothetical protein E7515_08305 [Ruminococcaceae bacterium]|jgi:hypothetical protein|nr:hypothetical protein [Oscillospiraceae bacterium]
MNTNKIRIIAVICLLALVVGVFAACKKNKEEELVSVSTDENGSLYYTDPTYEVDGVEYGGETHFVKPEETNKNGEYKVGDVTSEAYTTNRAGELAPAKSEGTTTVPSEDGTTTTTKKNDSSSDKTTKQNSSDPTEKPSDGTPSETPTEPTEEPTYAGIDDAVDGNNLNDDGVINAW